METIGSLFRASGFYGLRLRGFRFQVRASLKSASRAQGLAFNVVLWQLLFRV